MRFYANENFPKPAVIALRTLGHDVLTTAEAQKAGLSDPDVVAFSTAEKRAVVTLNRRDFIRIHRTGAAHAGIVVARNDDDFQRLAQRVHDATSHHADLAGVLVEVTKPPP